jgi:hypothetical protein
MIKILEKNHLFLIFFLLFGAVGLVGNPIFAGIVGYLIFIIGLVDVFKSNNKNGEAHLYMALIGVFELYLRMSKSVAPHEISKYSLIAFSALGLFFSRKRRLPNGLSILFILLFLPSLVAVDTNLEFWREIVMTTVLGPVGLGVLLAYFYNYQLNSVDIQNLCRAIILPISSVLVYIQTNTISFDELAEVNFTASNSSLSGNFGPNQVSIMMGIGAGILLYSIFFGIKIFKYKLLDYAVLGFCVFRGLLTFSRGGVTVPFIAFALIILLSFVRVRNLQSFKKGIYLVLGAGLFYLVFLLANSVTGSALEKRYSGETGLTEKTGERDVLSGRDQILFIDLQIFADNFLIGVGPGMAKPLRYYYGFSNSVSAHIEISRIFAEHGLLGVFAIIIYIIIIYSKRKRWRTYPNETFFLLFLWWIGFLNSNHNSFRLGITVFFLGIIVARINNNPKYFSASSKKKYRKEWEEWIGINQNPSEAAPNNAASDPANKLGTSSTFPR